MATNAKTIKPPTPLTPGRLLPATLIVAAFASIAASLITGIVITVDAAVYAGGRMGANEAFLGTLMVASVALIISFLVVLAALLLVALPPTLVLVRLGVPPAVRNMVLLAIAVAAAPLLWIYSVQTYQGWDWIYPTYAIVSAIVWIKWLGRMERQAMAG